MPGIRDFGIISELGWDYGVKLLERHVVIHQRAVGEERAGVR